MVTAVAVRAPVQGAGATDAFEPLGQQAPQVMVFPFPLTDGEPTVIYATGFDAITGSFDEIDLRGANGARLKLSASWAARRMPRGASGSWDRSRRKGWIRPSCRAS